MVRCVWSITWVTTCATPQLRGVRAANSTAGDSLLQFLQTCLIPRPSSRAGSLPAGPAVSQFTVRHPRGSAGLRGEAKCGDVGGEKRHGRGSGGRTRVGGALAPPGVQPGKCMWTPLEGTTRLMHRGPLRPSQWAGRGSFLLRSCPPQEKTASSSPRPIISASLSQRRLVSVWGFPAGLRMLFSSHSFRFSAVPDMLCLTDF